MNEEIRVGIDCMSCRFYCDTEDDVGYCCLFATTIEKDVDGEGIRHEKCTPNMVIMLGERYEC